MLYRQSLFYMKVFSLGFLLVKSYCWGNDGHMLVASLALDILAKHDPRVLDKIQEVFSREQYDFIEGSTWPDKIKVDQFMFTKSWHFHNFNNDFCNITSELCKNGDCNTNAILELSKTYSIIELKKSMGTCIRQFMKGSEQGNDESGKWKIWSPAEIIMFLTHFLGDLHQPFHQGAEADRGANNIHVVFNGIETNLHWVWDTGVIRVLRQRNGLAGSFPLWASSFSLTDKIELTTEDENTSFSQKKISTAAFPNSLLSIEELYLQTTGMLTSATSNNRLKLRKVGLQTEINNSQRPVDVLSAAVLSWGSEGAHIACSKGYWHHGVRFESLNNMMPFHQSSDFPNNHHHMKRNKQYLGNERVYYLNTQEYSEEIGDLLMNQLRKGAARLAAVFSFLYSFM